MRGGDLQQGAMWSTVSPEQRVPADHPLRPIREMVNAVLKDMSPTFSRIYSREGRPSIPPEHLLRALLLQVLFSVRSERQLMEQLNYNLLFRWFVGLNMDDAVWSPTTFSKNRERLIDASIADKFFDRVGFLAREAGLLSEEHFTLDGTLVEAWAGHKSFKPKDSVGPDSDDDPGNPSVDFRGQTRTNDTHASTTDPEARLYRKSNGTESKLCFAGHVLMDNRHGLAVDSRLTTATGRSEWEAGLAMAKEIAPRRRVTIGADKGYDIKAFVEGLRALGITPHVAAKVSQGAIDGRTTRHANYVISQRKRKRVEEIFGWLKTVAQLRKTRHRGRQRIEWIFRFALAVYNLVRMRKLVWGTS
jgi:transposase